MITIKNSSAADTRSCDPAFVTKGQLLAASEQHIEDVAKALEYFRCVLEEAKGDHDWDKIMNINGFYEGFQTKFQDRTWLDKHYTINRHHLLEPTGIPDNVDLIDVLELIADWVMAGMGRSGEVRPIEIDPALLTTAFHNTVKLLKDNVKVEN